MNTTTQNYRRLTPFFVLVTALIACPVSAQVFVGTDNFNDNTLTIQGSSNQAAGQWRLNGATPSVSAWTETNQRMEYTTNAGNTNIDNLVWVSPSTSVNGAPSGTNLGIGGTGLSSGNPYNSSWTAQLTITNKVAGSSGGASAGFELYTYNATPNYNAFYGIYLDTAIGGNSVILQWGKNLGSGATLNFERHDISVNPATSINDVVLRLDYNGSTKLMSGFYSFDNGSSFLSAGSFDLAGAQAGLEAPLYNGMGLELIGNPHGGMAIASGDMTFDNLSVSAVPEPSTYAMLTGLSALGLAAWRRRKARAIAN